MKQNLTKENTLKVFTILLFTLLSVTISKSTENYKNIFNIDTKLGAGLNFHNADFNAFTGMYNCCNFENGSKFGFIGGLDLNYSIGNDIEMFLGAYYAARSVTLSYDEILNIYNDQTGIVTKATNRYNLVATLDNMEFAFGFKYILSKDLIAGPFKLIGAGKLFFPLKSNFEQVKEAVSPEGHVINVNGQNLLEYKMAEGSIPDRYNPGVGFNVGFQNQLESGENSYFTQTLSLDYCFTDIVENTDWMHYSINLLLGFNFDIYSKSIIPENIEIHSESLEKSPVRDSATIVPVIKENISPRIRIDRVIKDFHIEKGYELLCTSPKISSVFFDHNSFLIPSNYMSPNTDLTEYSDPIELHGNILYEILDVLKSHPEAKISVNAINSDDETIDGIENKRIESIVNFFLSQGIERNRIKKHDYIKKSNEKFETGFAENRRVDILLDGVLLTDFVSKNLMNDIIGYSKIVLDTNDILYPKKIKINDKYKKYQTLQSDMLFSYKIPVDSYDDELSYSATYLDTFMHDTTFRYSKSSMNVIYDEFKVDNFVAVLTFEYNSDILSDISKQTLKELVDFLPEGITLLISGSADISGTQDRNAELTQRRAKNAKRYLESLTPEKSFKFQETIDNERYSNASAVGRFLNRSIRIRIKKED